MPTSAAFFQQARYFKAENVGYFDPELDEEDTNLVINVGKYVFYKNVYAFVNRFKNLAATYGKKAIKKIFFTCLKGAAHMQHFVKLTQLKKEYVKTTTLARICRVMVFRFKKRGAVVLSALQSKKYGFFEAKSKTFRAYAQLMFRHARAVEITSVYNQFLAC